MTEKQNAKLTEHISQTLINKVVDWFKVRKLDTGNPFKQYLKLREETEEILTSLRYDSNLMYSREEKNAIVDEFIDGVGDTIVVIIGILTQTLKRHGDDITEINIHPALVNDDANERIRNAILKTSDVYTEYRIDLETTYPKEFIIHAIDDLRQKSSEYIFDIDFDPRKLAYYTALVSNIMRDILSLGAVYFNEPHLEELKLEDCLLVAYNEIKDRKGMLRNGMFVKEADLTEEELKELNA